MVWLPDGEIIWRYILIEYTKLTDQHCSTAEAKLGWKTRFLPQLGGPHRIVAIIFGMEKLEWYGYPMVKKFEDMFW